MTEQQPYIVCPKCGMVSHNPNDVRERYCGNCHAFHDELGQISGEVSEVKTAPERRGDGAHTGYYNGSYYGGGYPEGNVGEVVRTEAAPAGGKE